MTGPKSKHKANKWLLPILAFCSMLGVVFSIGGITLAAYINALKIKNEVKVDFSDLEQYFDGTIDNITENNETVGHRYYIANATQLQNFQKLVALGIFGEHDEFYLRNSIDCSGVTINPIGTEDLPFVSSFDGAGNTISGLNVESSAGRDVGLFGFTSITSTVKNLILDHPTITVKAKSGTASEILSPVETQFLGLAKTMPEIEINPENPATNVIAVDNPATNENDVATITGFPPSIGGYRITYSIVGEEYLEATYDQNGKLKIKGIATTRSAFDLFPTYIEAKVAYTIGDNFGYYVLERYQINVTGNGKVSATTGTVGDNQDVSTGAFKTIHPTYDDHKTNVGFFIGHCDGAASYLGLESSQGNAGLIIIEGNARTIR